MTPTGTSLVVKIDFNLVIATELGWDSRAVITFDMREKPIGTLACEAPEREKMIRSFPVGH